MTVVHPIREVFCGEKCKDRQCFALHKIKVEYERNFAPPALPSTGR
jgi:hypothetical protein